MTKRDFLAAGAGGLTLAIASAARGQTPAANPARPSRKVKTTKLFRSPGEHPNGLASSEEGLWIGQQKLSGAQAAQYHLTEPKDLLEAAWLVDWKGKLLKTVTTPSRNTSGMAVGDGHVWMCANAAPEGVFQVDMNSKLISHRQIPLGPANDGGGCHGAMWHEGKLWIASLRLRGILRVDPKSWEPEFLIPFYQAPDRNRYHDITWDNGTIWQVIGNDCKSYAEYRPGLVQYDATTGRVLELVDFVAGSSDPHGLVAHDGGFVSCDAGIHPNWPNDDSPTAGWIFRIDFV